MDIMLPPHTIYLYFFSCQRLFFKCLMIFVFSHLRVRLGWSGGRFHFISAVSLHHTRTPVLEVEAPALGPLNWSLRLEMDPWLPCVLLGNWLFHVPLASPPHFSSGYVSCFLYTVHPHSISEAWAPLWFCCGNVQPSLSRAACSSGFTVLHPLHQWPLSSPFLTSYIFAENVYPQWPPSCSLHRWEGNICSLLYNHFRGVRKEKCRTHVTNNLSF